MEKYLFTSARLGFRTWKQKDLYELAEINADKAVMEFFPGIINVENTGKFISRMQEQFKDKGYCYFAVDQLSDGKFVGFIGISEQYFESDFTPCVDIGWRLGKKFWGKGYATEGARRCLEYAFKNLKLGKIYALAPKVNKRSINVMQKLGMRQVKTFIHPKIKEHEKLKECVLFIKENNEL